MPHLQRLATPLLVLVALIAAVTLVTAPASAQNEGVKVFVIGNDMVNDEDKEERWEIQVTARPVGGCTPTKGDVEYSSPWIETGAEVAAELSLGECVFRISVTMRQASSPVDCWYTAQLRWGELADEATPTDDYVFTADRPDGVSRISAVRKATSHCAYPTEMRFYVNGTDVVEDLPGPSANADLLALAKRAAEIAAFEVRLEPDSTAGSVPAGCDRTGSLTVLGDGQRVRHSLQSTGGPCRYQATIVDADAPFEAVQDRTVGFAEDARIINLTSLARLPQARIAIIQSVRGSANQGTASYTVARSCGRHSVTSPAAAVASAALQDGRFTVHAPHAPLLRGDRHLPGGCRWSRRRHHRRLLGDGLGAGSAFCLHRRRRLVADPHLDRGRTDQRVRLRVRHQVRRGGYIYRDRRDGHDHDRSPGSDDDHDGSRSPRGCGGHVRGVGGGGRRNRRTGAERRTAVRYADRLITPIAGASSPVIEPRVPVTFSRNAIRGARARGNYAWATTLGQLVGIVDPRFTGLGRKEGTPNVACSDSQ